MDQIYFFSGSKIKFLGNINDLFETSKRDCYVVVGGSRGSNVLARSFEKKYPKLLSNIPNDWIPLKTIQGEKNELRSRNLTIYYIPQEEN